MLGYTCWYSSTCHGQLITSVSNLNVSYPEGQWKTQRDTKENLSPTNQAFQYKIDLTIFSFDLSKMIPNIPCVSLKSYECMNNPVLDEVKFFALGSLKLHVSKTWRLF